jgi:hypothetical protein
MEAGALLRKPFATKSPDRLIAETEDRNEQLKKGVGRSTSSPSGSAGRRADRLGLRSAGRERRDRELTFGGARDRGDDVLDGRLRGSSARS